MTIKQTPKHCPQCGAPRYGFIELQTDIGVIIAYGCGECGHREKTF